MQCRTCDPVKGSTLQSSVNRLAVQDEVWLGTEKLSQGRVDVIKINIRGESIDPGIDAGRLGTEQKSACRKQVRQNPEVGDTPGIGGIGLIASDALEVVALEVVFPGRLQRLRRDIGMSPQNCIPE